MVWDNQLSIWKKRITWIAASPLTLKSILGRLKIWKNIFLNNRKGKVFLSKNNKNLNAVSFKT